MYNGHGDVVKVVDSNGRVTKDYEYDAFGVVNNENATDINPWRYCGEYYDTETGNIFLRARYYDPSTGGFITEDPARDGVNWYGYCGGNPVSFWDPSGLERIVISGGVYSENPVHGKFDYNFIETALRAINDNLAENNQESVTWIIADAGYTKEDKLNFRKSIDGLNVNIVYIESDEAFVDYINNKDGNNRNSDKITRVDIFSHGLVGEVDLGYNYVDNNGKN